MTRFIPQFVTAAAVTAVLALGSGGAWAQSAGPGGPAPSRAAAPPANNAPSSTSHTTLMKNPLASEDISQIDGTSVAGADGSKIGSVSTVLMDPSSKKVDRLVVAEGGVLGVGAHKVALPVDAFRWDAKNHNFVIQKSADDLKAMPEWQQPQLAEAPSGSSAAPSSRESGVAAGTSAGAPAGAATAPIAPSGKAR